MLQSTSSVHDDLVSFQPVRHPRRLRLSRPTAAILTVAAILASGVAVGRLDTPHPRPAQADQAQPFDHFPR